MFKKYTEVEEALDITLTAMQAMLVQNYLDNGVRPPATSCSGCDEAYVRVLTGRIDEAAASLPKAEVTEVQDTPRRRRTTKKVVTVSTDGNNFQGHGTGAGDK